MNHQHTPNDTPIAINPDLNSAGKSLAAAIGAILIGLFAIVIGRTPWHPKMTMIIGIICIAFGIAGIAAYFMQLKRRIADRPICMIYSDRIEQQNMFKRVRHQTVLFADVRRFIVTNFQDNKFIRCQCNDGDIIDTVLSSATVKDVDSLCNILNTRLDNYRKTESSSGAYIEVVRLSGC